jgi:hypothetical protein
LTYICLDLPTAIGQDNDGWFVLKENMQKKNNGFPYGEKDEWMIGNISYTDILAMRYAHPGCSL